MRYAGAVATLLVLLVGASGCAYFHYPENAELVGLPASSGYRFPPPPQAPAEDSRDELFVCLALSGGGTRAAAFAFGVLKALRDIRIDRNSLGSLLDEVDCISGISGGAFAAAGYGLMGGDFFEEFPKRFLDRNIQARLIWNTLNPVNLIRLASPYFDRIDLAAEVYGPVFDQKTFGSLNPDHRPFVILNATNMANGAGVEFTQDEFDLLNSDLASVPIARAVAASSAFPFLLSPLTVWSYPGPLSNPLPADVLNALNDREVNLVGYSWARARQSLTTTRGKKYIHLLDGGLADNIGARAIINAFDRGFIRRRILDGRIRRLVILIVNAKTAPAEHLTESPRGPGIISVGLATANAPMDNYSTDTVALVQHLITDAFQAQQVLASCNARLVQCSTPRPRQFAPMAAVRSCVIELSFEGLDPEARDELLNYPTSFSLNKTQVDKLIAAGPTLLNRSQDFQRLVQALRGETMIGRGVGEDVRPCS